MIKQYSTEENEELVTDDSEDYRKVPEEFINMRNTVFELDEQRMH